MAENEKSLFAEIFDTISDFLTRRNVSLTVDDTNKKIEFKTNKDDKTISFNVDNK